MRCFPVSARINQVQNDDAEYAKPVSWNRRHRRVVLLRVEEKADDVCNEMARRYSGGSRLQRVSYCRHAVNRVTKTRNLIRSNSTDIIRTHTARQTSSLGIIRRKWFLTCLQRLQVLDDFHALLRGQLAADHSVALRTVVEFVPSV